MKTDVLVVGSGAGALVAALTAHINGSDVIIIEKGDQLGGTSAMSGGGIWIPNSHYARAQGVDDSTEEAIAYMKAVIGDVVEEDRIRAFAEGAPAMLEFLDKNTRLKYEPYDYPDYYPEEPGGKTGYRTHSPMPMNARHLKDFLQYLKPTPAQSTMNGISITFSEGRSFLTQAPGWKLTAAKMMLRYYLDIPARLKGKRDYRLTLGNALVGRLLWSVRERNIPVYRETAFEKLIEKDGRVVGAVVSRDGKPEEISVSKGVILGAGGFEKNQEMREKYLPSPSNKKWSGGNHNNTGDAIRGGLEIGAKTTLMKHAWWAPSIKVPGWPQPFILFAERSLPGLVIVNKHGKRFANEAAPYLESGLSMYENTTQEVSVPSYLIFDATFRKKFPLGPIGPGWAFPDERLPKDVKEILVKADTIEALAKALNIDATNLADTIAKNNDYAVTGKDLEFGRGDSYYDKFYGDSTNVPNPCIAPMNKAPFYAIPIYPGDIGTKGGLHTNANGQVVREDDTPITGLYAIGNSSSSVMGDKYPGAGATIGPAMTFGYLAARHITGQNS
jgi:3-oxosteroid 1-dehydrogenase